MKSFEEVRERLEREAWGPDKVRQLLEHVNAKWGKKGCPRCEVNSWAVLGYVNLALEAHVGLGGHAMGGLGLLLTAQNAPSAALVCQGCGATVLVNLIVAGVMKAPAPVEPEGGGA